MPGKTKCDYSPDGESPLYMVNSGFPNSPQGFSILVPGPLTIEVFRKAQTPVPPPQRFEVHYESVNSVSDRIEIVYIPVEEPSVRNTMVLEYVDDNLFKIISERSTDRRVQNIMDASKKLENWWIRCVR